MQINFSGWFGFWMFMIVFVGLEYSLYVKGNDTFFWQYKPQAEKQMQQKIIHEGENK